MERILIKDAKQNIDKPILIMGRILNVRKLSAVSFLQVQDYSGAIQTVWEKENEAKMGDTVEIKGEVKKDERAKGGCEILGQEIKVLSASIEDLPIDLAKKDLNLQLPTLLDQRALSLRHPKVQAIFKLYDLLLKHYGSAMRANGFTEIKTPKILCAASEGGANFFKIKYFDQTAYLAQSPQFYKQMMVGVFERVFEIGTTFRAEPSFTTRHVSEYISLDGEMGFINGFEDVAKMLNKVLVEVFGRIQEEGAEFLSVYGIADISVPKEIPMVKLSEIREIIKKKYNYDIPETTDIDPEGERLAGRYAKEEFNSDFIFITNYFWKDKPFYTMPSTANPEETEGFDLLYKGVEIVTGSQRIHKYDELIENMKKKGIKPDGMEYYLEVFKFAMPPHGGWGMGSERLIQQMLGLGSIKEAILFPRDVKRLSP
ncbi:MAG: aspartate--tRNA(Asn) ligase [Candidatus Portnoybacteria bacterium]|nr:aspartate--tRNA(Asn) ligase [Candidatus Portnoybacteria bacterium]MDD4982637.1 aspartate--tRNA(Asn) ligase [Candidatus Portnoybacteria bacterium]